MAKVTVRHGRLSRYSSMGMMLLGAFTLLFVSGFFGLILIAIGVVMYRFYGRQSRPSLGAPPAPGGEAAPSSQPATVIKEKETQIVVKIPCRYCGTLNDQLSAKCESCGATLR